MALKIWAWRKNALSGSAGLYGFRRAEVLAAAHLVLGNCSLAEADGVLVQARKILSQRFGIDHVTLQVECAPCEGLTCNGRDRCAR